MSASTVKWTRYQFDGMPAWTLTLDDGMQVMVRSIGRAVWVWEIGPNVTASWNRHAWHHGSAAGSKQAKTDVLTKISQLGRTVA